MPMLTETTPAGVLSVSGPLRDFSRLSARLSDLGGIGGLRNDDGELVAAEARKHVLSARTDEPGPA